MNWGPTAPGAPAPPWAWNWEVNPWDWGYEPGWQQPSDVPQHVVVEIEVVAESIALGALARDFAKRRKVERLIHGALRRPWEMWGGTWVGWTSPPHPIDFVPSLNPKDSPQQQARSVIYSFHYDDDTRTWFDNVFVQAAFGAKNTEEMDPVRVIQAYENPKDKVWDTIAHAPFGGTHSSSDAWKDLDNRVKAAIARRKKLGPLPASSYDTDPIVIYYYDHDRMKKIVWPRHQVPCALDPTSGNFKTWWRCGGDIFTYETNDPKKIEAERKNPGAPSGCYTKGRDACRGGGAGGWGDEGFDWNKDMPGNADVVFTAIASIVMEIIGAVLDVTGIGAALGVALNIMGAVLPAVIGGIAGLIDAGFQGTDPSQALLGMAQALMQAASSGFSASSGVKMTPEATQALAETYGMLSKAMASAHKQRLDYSEAWNKVAAQAHKYSKLGDEEAHALSVLLGPDKAGKLFMHGYLVGKLATMPQIGAIATIVQSYGTFEHSPKAFNIFLLGAGIGHLTAVQQGDAPKPLPPSKKTGSIARQDASIKLHAPKPAPKPPESPHPSRWTPARGGTRHPPHRVGMEAFNATAARAAHDDLDTFVGLLEPRYSGTEPSPGTYVVGQQDSGQQWDPLAWGCPPGTWRDPLSNDCLPKRPLCPNGYVFDLDSGTCVIASAVSPGSSASSGQPATLWAPWW